MAHSLEIRNALLVAGLAAVGLPGRAAAQTEWHLSPTPRLQLGGADQPTVEFFQIRTVLFLDDGSIVVANSGTKQLRLFDRQGKRYRTLGRDGSGPGEFRQLSWVGRRGDTLIIADGTAQRITRFLTDGTHVGSVRIAGDTAGRFGIQGQLANGTWLVATLSSPRLEGAQRVYRDTVRVGLLPATADQPVAWLGAFPGYHYFVFNPTGAARGQAVGAAPFRPGLAIAAAGEWVLIGDTAHDTVWVYSQTGARSGSLRLPTTATPLTRAEAARIKAERLAGDFARAPRELLDAFFSPSTLPATLPGYGSLRSEADGTIWIAPFSASRQDALTYRVLDRAGRLLATVRCPKGLILHAVSATDVLGVHVDEDGVESVQLFGLVRR